MGVLEVSARHRTQGGEGGVVMNIPAVIFIILIAIVYSFAMGMVYEQHLYQLEAIRHNCGQYNPQSGSFEWLPINEGTRP